MTTVLRLPAKDKVGGPPARYRLLPRSRKVGKKHIASQDLLRSLEPTAHAGTVREMPGRLRSKPPSAEPAKVESFQEERHHAGVFAVLARCLVWLRVFGTFQLGILVDKIVRRDSTDRRARRLLRLFQMAGGTFVKIGQQLAMRIDLLPHEYCRELSKLHDAVPPFPSRSALEMVRRATRRPLEETFALFDPTPIGSASIACVYQAVLKSGERVAVKIRRPGIGKLFAADLKAMSWLVRCFEMLAIIRPGYMDNFVQEFSTAILEELDFRMEAYHQTIFRREARKNRLGRRRFFTAPKIYYELSSREIIVEGFVSGISMAEILAAVESNDQETFARLRELNIKPKLVAKRLYWLQLWGQLVSPLYHADPHPANIIVQRNSKLVFIDFGACASVSHGKQRVSVDYMSAHARRDIAGVVRCMLAFMEPFPRVDMFKLMKDLEIAIGGVMRRVWSKRAPWYEKTSASLFYKLFEITRKYDIPVNLDTVRVFRANMLYDTLAIRIYSDLEPLREIRRFLADYERNLEDEVARGLSRRLEKGLITGTEIAAIRNLVDTGTHGLQSLQRFLDRPAFGMIAMIKKSAYVVTEIVKLIINTTGVTLVSGFIVAYVQHQQGLDIELADVAADAVLNKAWCVIVGALIVITTRRIMVRLADVDG